ncbi:chemotaxis protein CheX [Shewanella sp. NFH-SH190041]|uniref:chemotaxis protein CheX n=1 Tax=Shewanella sp. NFH-SH190041 TaxID=2950245 RepID=UPI0021C3B35A|nr:chemotaxis protein CheX [Shewanella sp. NFH-SH190041]BDM65808.1 chemotaxis protein CheX [Shewanella sp. NFH-SH190041]
MNVQFINPFLESFLNVINTMATLQLTPSRPQIKLDEVARGDVSGLIGMVGPQVKGSLSITFEEQLACKVMQNMLGEAPEELNEEVTDMVGEITNMVAGGAKKILGEQGFEFDMATPVVVAGKDHHIAHICTGKKLIMPFNSIFGKAYIEICFEK